MKAFKITDEVYWVGAIDWDLRNFHGYQTEQGSTYNAYLIIDEKITLIDTVKNKFCGEMIKRISSIIDLTQIDYIISNHVEMDHSGSIQKLVENIDNVEVLSSTQGKKGLNAHFDIRNWNIKAVNPGNTLDLGENKLHFVLTPMVHWPDNMVTYLENENILFSNDAFGQHYASYERFDHQIPLDVVMKEAKKYYANIVMPYGSQVEKVLKKVNNLNIDIDTIAPSHGIIWENNIKEILEQYNKWCTNKTQEEALIVYDSMWGSTEKLAYTLYEFFEEKKITTNIKNLDKTHRSNIIPHILDADYVCIGSPTLNNNMLPSISAFLTYLKGLSPGGKKAIAFGSYGWGGQSINQVKDELEKADFQVIDTIDTEYVPGRQELENIKDNITL